MPETSKPGEKSVQIEVLDKIAALVTVGFGLIAALAWNDAIRTLVGVFFEAGEALAPQLIYAIIVTVIAVAASVFIARLAAKAKEELPPPARGATPPPMPPPTGRASP